MSPVPGGRSTTRYSTSRQLVSFRVGQFLRVTGQDATQAGRLGVVGGCLVAIERHFATPGSTPPELALSIDIAPTLLDAAGLQPGPGMQGRSLVPVLKNEAREWRTSFLIEYFTDMVYPRIRNMGYVAARTTRHKYINYRELQGMDELYDLDKDPYEEMNLIDRSDARQTLQQMQAELRSLMEQTRYSAPVSSVTAR